MLTKFCWSFHYKQFKTAQYVVQLSQNLLKLSVCQGLHLGLTIRKMQDDSSFNIAKQISYFESIEGYFLCDIRLLAFINKDSSNDNLECILQKVSAISDRSLWQNGGQYSLAVYMHSLNLDSRLKYGDLTAVTDIGNYNLNSNPYSLLHFSSKYCCFHFPDLFPIYSNPSLRIIKTFNSNNSTVVNWPYENYSKLMTVLKRQFGLNTLNYLEIDKFLWLYEEQLCSVIIKNTLRL